MGHRQAEVTAVDSHAHIFSRALPFAAERRYTPAYEATLADYLAMLAANGLSHGVLVQPSFLGADNSQLVAALAAAPHRLRGIAVLSPEAPEDQLDELDRGGVVGLRLNLLGQPDPPLPSRHWRRHLVRVAARRWQVEVQAEAARLAGLVPPLLDAGLNVVIDHFGRPDPQLGIDDPGFRSLLTAGASGRLWVKLSGAYRLGPTGDDLACRAVPLLRDALGLDHLLWGSDWPHTQYEDCAAMTQARRSLDRWLPDPGDRQVVLADAPRRLFGFGGAG